MSKKKAYFMGLLANVDSSILKVNLEHGFKIEAMSGWEAYKFFSILENIPEQKVSIKLGRLRCISSEFNIYFVKKSYKPKIDNEGRVYVNLDPKDQIYIQHAISLMRLFKEGNVCIPLRYEYYCTDDNIPRLRQWSESSYPTWELYTLENSEISDLEKFIGNIKLPFKESFLQLAFENFELTYHISDTNLSFLSLMMSLEALFNKDRGEMRYKLSRNAAVLLGKDKEEAEKIFSDVRDLYDKRSKLVHTGKRNTITPEDLQKLRYYVRESIKEVYKAKKDKDELLDILNSCGFGVRPWAV